MLIGCNDVEKEQQYSHATNYSLQSSSSEARRLKKVIDCKDFNKQPKTETHLFFSPPPLFLLAKSLQGAKRGWLHGMGGGIHGNCVKLLRGLVKL